MQTARLFDISIFKQERCTTFQHIVLGHMVEVFSQRHDDVIKWKHFPRYWPFVRGIHRSPVNYAHKGLWRGSLMFSLICVWIKDWVNNREIGDWRHYRTSYDVIVMRTMPLFTKRTIVLPQNPVKSRSRKIGCYNDRIALKFNRHLGCTAAISE